MYLTTEGDPGPEWPGQPRRLPLRPAEPSTWTEGGVCAGKWVDGLLVIGTEDTPFLFFLGSTWCL